MTRLTLFDEDFSIEPTPGQINRTGGQRRAWRIRQRRSRATRKMAARVEVARGLVNAAPAAEPGPGVVSLWVILGAMQLGGPLARRVFEKVRPEDFSSPDLGLIFEAAKRLHDRGVTVSRETVRAELRRAKILLFDEGQTLDGVFKAGLVPHLSLEDVDLHARGLKQA